MGVHTTTITMKTILLICAIAAIATANSYDDDEIVPETDFVQESTKGLPQCADIYNDAKSKSTYKSGPKKGQYTNHPGLKSCLCIPGSQEASGKNKKYAEKYVKKGYKECYKWPKKILNKMYPSDRPKGCDDGWGMVDAKDCAPPRPAKKAPKKCTCKIKNGKSHVKHVFHSTGDKAVTVKNKEWGGLFRGMTCTGCEYVKVTDADPNTFWGGYAQDIYLGKNSAARHAAKGDKRMKGAMGNNKSCCGKNTCSVEGIAGNVHIAHDLRDDVGEIVMQGAC